MAQFQAISRVEKAGFKRRCYIVNRPIFMLFAEDDPDDKTFLELALQSMGCETTTLRAMEWKSSSICKAKENSRQDEISRRRPVSYSMCNMPRMNGIEVLEWLKKREDSASFRRFFSRARRAKANCVRAYQLGVRTVFKKAGLESDSSLHGMKLRRSIGHTRKFQIQTSSTVIQQSTNTIWRVANTRKHN